MPERPLPTEKEVQSWIRERRNWGRWGKDDQIGALNLVTPAKRAAAARLVKSGRSVSLSRPFPKEPGPNNALPAQHYMKTLPRGKGGFAADYYGIFYHGVASTHIDALCHTWDDEAMWNGRDPKQEITFDGARFGSIEHWSEGILTRGVMLDVPRHRGVACVTQDTPVHGWELEDILVKRGIRLEPGDAVCVYSGREAWQAQDPERPYSRPFTAGQQPQRPGLHVSCLPFLRDHDVSVLVWDMLDHLPIGYD
ncbi:MAG: cyclase family protein, partial [Candidatus Rokubacteria bacterium]|nr:cyclase family protein [Candidatus Rokubacteria bacterium]